MEKMCKPPVKSTLKLKWHDFDFQHLWVAPKTNMAILIQNPAVGAAT